MVSVGHGVLKNYHRATSLKKMPRRLLAVYKNSFKEKWFLLVTTIKLEIIMAFVSKLN